MFLRKLAQNLFCLLDRRLIECGFAFEWTKAFSGIDGSGEVSVDLDSVAIANLFTS